ncbi:hypothetical protein [Sporosarcina sp. E16_8]|uniref:hypothetical protein n=1 Tax=Sporosarcina sp. E16_8 TaxID=2789295 RepID=UPI001A9191F2|nr:hypothetical protein [Sporosarcina sp. E16_8]MBO0588961.1 hypothetical protein [Sporosarcina sp. E16_8]
MYEGFEIWSFLVGLPLALVIVSIVLLINRKIGKKERLFDERYKRIHQQARSISWGVTAAAILIAWMIVMIVEGPRLAFFILTGIWVTHMMSYLIGAVIASSKN